eukprot:8629759-Alexandrium_andersonii.AAC.1
MFLSPVSRLASESISALASNSLDSDWSSQIAKELFERSGGSRLSGTSLFPARTLERSFVDLQHCPKSRPLLYQLRGCHSVESFLDLGGG